MSFATLDDLRVNLGRKEPSAAYVEKMWHRVPAAPVVDRVAFILSQVQGQVVLDIGASGPMHEAIVKAAATCYGVDKVVSDGVVGVDLDADRLRLPLYEDVTRIVCGEVLEHLSNPGHFLRMLGAAYPGIETIITVPNAFSAAAAQSLARGIESVNKDHVAWYSWKTLTVLLERHGYRVKEWCWYNGVPLTAEGLVFVVESQHG